MNGTEKDLASKGRRDDEKDAEMRGPEMIGEAAGTGVIVVSD